MKLQNYGRTSRGVIDVGEAVFRRKRKTEWTLKLRTLYSYGLHEKVDICENDKSMKMFKSDDDIIRKLFPSLVRLFQRDQICGHGNRKEITILN